MEYFRWSYVQLNDKYNWGASECMPAFELEKRKQLIII